MKIILLIAFLSLADFVHAADNVGEQKLRANLSTEVVNLKSLVKKDLAVVIAYGVECPIFGKHVPTINKISKEYSAKGISFLLINAIKNSPEKEIDEILKSFGVELPAYHDTQATLLKRFGFTTLSEAALIKISTNEVLYKGAINNQVTLDLTRDKATENYLVDAMDRALKNRPVKLKTTKVFGCEITY